MKLKVLASILLLPLFMFVVLPVYAQSQYRADETTVVGQNEVTAGDYFTAGESVTILGKVAGDAYVAGGNVVIEGTVAGDLLAIGGNVIVRGTVAQDVRVVGGQITIDGTVGGNISTAGGSVTVNNRASLAKNLAIAGGNITIAAPLPGDLTIAGGNVTLDTTVSGNVTATVGNLHFTNTAKVLGNVVYVSDNQAQLQDRGQVVGTLTHKQPSEAANAKAQESFKSFSSFNLVFGVIGFFSSLILGLLLIKFFPVYSKRSVTMISERYWTLLLVGFVAIIGMPILAILLLITLIGVPFSVLLITTLIALLIFSKVFVALWLGDRVFKQFKSTRSLTVTYIVGLILYEILTAIPIIGWIGGFVGTLIGMGVLIMQKKYAYGKLKAMGEI